MFLRRVGNVKADMVAPLTNILPLPEGLAPPGLCQCGCGGRTTPAQTTRRSLGRVRDEPLRFVRGHQARQPIRWVAVPMGYKTPCHLWQLAKDFGGYGLVRVEGKL